MEFDAVELLFSHEDRFVGPEFIFVDLLRQV